MGIYKSNVVYLLNELANSEPEQYETGVMEIRFEDEDGRDTGCDVSVSELATSASIRIEKLEDTCQRLKDLHLWSLGHFGFPMRQDGDGAYWWRKELRQKLNEILNDAE